jgi:hypothetical protein
MRVDSTYPSMKPLPRVKPKPMKTRPIPGMIQREDYERRQFEQAFKKS